MAYDCLAYIRLASLVVAMGITVMLLEAITMLVASLGLNSFSPGQAPLEIKPKKSTQLSWIALWVAMPIAYCMATLASICIQLNNDFGRVFLLWTALIVTFLLMLSLIYPKPESILRQYSRKQMVVVSLSAIVVAMLMAAPQVLIHEWGHSVMYDFLFKPSGGQLIVSLLEGEFSHKGATFFSPLLNPIHFLSAETAKIFVTAAGVMMTLLYASALHFVSRFMKRWPHLRHAFRLGALSVSLLGLQYFRNSAAPDETTDWAKIWSDAPGWLSHGISLLSFFFPYVFLRWGSQAIQKEWQTAPTETNISIFAKFTDHIVNGVMRVWNWFWELPRMVPYAVYALITGMAAVSYKTVSSDPIYILGFLLCVAAVPLMLLEFYLMGGATPGLPRDWILPIILQEIQREGRRGGIRGLKKKDRPIIEWLERLKRAERD